MKLYTFQKKILVLSICFPKQINGIIIIEKKNVSCFDIGEVPRSPGKWNWNRLSFFGIHFQFRTMCIMLAKFDEIIGFLPLC